MQYKEILERKHGKILVWGCGYIGLSTIAFFAKKKKFILSVLTLIKKKLNH